MNCCIPGTCILDSGHAQKGNNGTAHPWLHLSSQPRHQIDRAKRGCIIRRFVSCCSAAQWLSNAGWTKSASQMHWHCAEIGETECCGTL